MSAAVPATGDEGLRRVLIVEGRPAVTSQLAALGSQAAVALEHAENAIRALAIARAAPPEFLVVDVSLPLMDGFATFAAVRRDPREGFPFSMKDLALPDHIPALQSSGVSCFKIEGRKKSPLYVATTTDYYRKLIDGKLTPEERVTH